MLLFELFLRQRANKRRGCLSGNNHVVGEIGRASEKGDCFVDVVVRFAQGFAIQLAIGEAHVEQSVEIIVDGSHVSRSGRGNDGAGDFV